MKLSQSIALTFAILFGFSSTGSEAADTLYTVEGDFLGAVAGYSLESFENLPVENSTQVQTIVLGEFIIGPASLGVFNQEYSVGSGQHATDGSKYILWEAFTETTQLRFVFNEPQTAVALTLTDALDGGGSYSLSCTTNAGSSFPDIASEPLPNANELFIGIVTANPFTSFVLFGAQGDGIGLDEVLSGGYRIPTGPPYEIVSIQDVGNDQGRRVRLTWNRSLQDQLGADTPVTAYSIWRRVLPGLARTEDRKVATPGVMLAYPPGDWDYVVSVPAFGEDSYFTVTETLCDSTISEGPCWSTFFVRAQTASPYVFFDTLPDSGYSVDNLVPAAPAGFSFSLAPPLTMKWTASVEEDFKYFTIYGSDTKVFDEGASVIATVVDPEVDLSLHPYGYYHLSATDFSGNEGPVGTAVWPFTGTVPQPGIMPTEVSLGPIWPNPFQSSARFDVDVPRTQEVLIGVMDVQGRLVRTLVSQQLPAGRYTVEWHGVDDRGQRVPDGVYYYALSAGGQQQARKVVRLR